MCVCVCVCLYVCMCKIKEYGSKDKKTEDFLLLTSFQCDGMYLHLCTF